MPAVHVVTPDGERAVYDADEARKLHAAGDFPDGTRFWIPGITEWRPVEEMVATLGNYRPQDDGSEAFPPEPDNVPFTPVQSNIQEFGRTSRLATAAFVLGLVPFFQSLIPANPLLKLLVAVAAAGCGYAALSAIRESAGALCGRGKAITGLALGFFFVLQIILFPLFRDTNHGPSRTTDAFNLRHIGQASLIYANDHRETLPPVTIVEQSVERLATIHDVALLLAFGGGLNDSMFWFSMYDDALSGKERDITTVLGPPLAPRTEDPWERGLNPDFARQEVFSFDYVAGLTTSMPSTTPIAWTRGLRFDGTWDEEGVYGTDGGHIVFLGGNVSFYKDLGFGDSGKLMGVNGERTSNILEALPVGTRVVGGGPATLNGATGRGEAGANLE